MNKLYLVLLLSVVSWISSEEPHLSLEAPLPTLTAPQRGSRNVCSTPSFRRYIGLNGTSVDRPQLTARGDDFTLYFTIRTAMNKNVSGLCQLNSDGEVAWMKGYEYSISTDVDYVLPTRNGDMVIVAGRSARLFIARLDADGELLWAYEYDDLNRNFATSVVESPDGSLLVVGGTELNYTRRSGLLMKLSADGQVEWSTRLSLTAPGTFNTRRLYLASMVLSPDGGYCIVGRTDALNARNSPLVLIKLDRNGTLEWTRLYDEEVNDKLLLTLNENADGYYLLYNRGLYQGTATGLMEVDLDGQPRRAQTILSSNRINSDQITRLSNGQFLISGTMTTPNNGQDRTMAMLLDQQWNIIDSKYYGERLGQYGSANTIGNSHVVRGDEFYFTAAHFNSPLPRRIYLVKTDTRLRDNCASTSFQFTVESNVVTSSLHDFDDSYQLAQRIPAVLQVYDLSPTETVDCVNEGSVGTPTVTNEQLSFCEGETAVVFGNAVTESGIYVETFIGANGCDSTHQVLVDVSSTVLTEASFQLCAGETMMVFGEAVGSSGQFSAMFVGSNGCDSTHQINVNFIDEVRTAEALQLCTGDTTMVFGNVVTTDALLQETFTGALGCDSTHQVQVNFADEVFTSEVQQLCEGETTVVFGQTVTGDALLEETFVGALGCDSTHQVRVDFTAEVFTSEVRQLCEGETTMVFGQMVAEDALLRETFIGASGCDSIHQVQVDVTDAVFTSEFRQLCEGEATMVFGQMVADDALLQEMFVGASGCDSTHQVQVDVTDTTFTTEVRQLCAGETTMVFGNVVTTDALLQETFTGASGCDSTHQVQVNFADEVFTSEVRQLCEGETTVVFGQTVTGDASLQETFIGASGCDSIHQIQIDFTDTVFTSELRQLCAGEAAMVFGQTVTTDVLLQETFTGALGCDSTHQVQVEFTDTIFTAELRQLCAGEAAMVFGQTVTTDALLQETFTGALGCDSTHQVQVEFTDTIFTAELRQLCAGAATMVFGQMITEDALLQATFVGTQGCDSTHQVQIDFADTTFTTEVRQLCAGETTMVFGQLVTTDALLQETFTGASGCDSTHQIQLTFLEESTVTENTTLCAGDYTLFFNDTIREPGSYQYVETALGAACPTTFTLHVAPNPGLPFSLPTDTLIDNTQTLALPLALDDDSVQISWSPAELLSCPNCPTPEVQLNNNQVFEVTLENEWGCIATASIAVRVRIVEDGIYIPNAFSPNGDQFNDYFTVYADEQVAEVLKLQVFDRWGGLRHQSVRFLPNEARSGWDGTAAGEPLASGVYVYQLWLRMANGRTVFRTGDVTLLR